MLGQWGWGGGGVRELQRFKLFPLCRSFLSRVCFDTAVSVSPTDTWRWRTPQSLCPSRWGAGGREPLPRRSPGGLRAASGQRPRSAFLLKDDTTHGYEASTQWAHASTGRVQIWAWKGLLYDCYTADGMGVFAWSDNRMTQPLAGMLTR